MPINYYSPYSGAEVDSAVGIALNLGSGGALVSSGGSVSITADSGAYVNGSKVATEAYVDAAVSGAVIDSDLVSSIASNVVVSGGYSVNSLVTFSGGANVSDGLTLNGSNVATEAWVEGYVSQHGSTPEDIIDWNADSAYIPTLSGGVYYTFVKPISALQIDVVERSVLDASIVCNFSGGSVFLYPENVGIIGESEISSDGGVYRIGINAGQMIITPVSYTSTGVVTISGADTTSAWWVSAATINNNTQVTVYPGGGLVSAQVNSGADGMGRLELLGGYTSNVVVSNGGLMIVDPLAVAYDVTLSSGGLLGGFAMDTTSHWDKFTSTGAPLAAGVVITWNTLKVFSGAAISEPVVQSGCSLQLINEGCSAENITVSSGGRLDFSMPDDFDTNEFPLLTGSDTNIAEGALQYLGGEPAAGQCVNGSFTNLSGTYRINVGSGISVLSPIVGTSETGKARVYVASGGYVSGAQIGISGDIDVRPGGLAVDTVLGGYEAASRFQCELTVWGGTASNVTVSSNARLNCLSGGVVSGAVVVSSGGTAKSYRDALIDNLTMKGGELYVSGEGSVTTLVMSKGAKCVAGSGTISNLTLSAGASISTTPGTTITSLNILAGATGGVLKNASVTSLRLESSGGINVSSGWMGVALISGGSLRASSGFVIDDLQLLSGTTTTSRPTFNGSKSIVSNCSVYSRAALNIYSGTVVSQLYLSGGYIAASGGTIYNARVEGSDFTISGGVNGGASVINLIAVVGSQVSPRKKIIVSNATVDNLLVEETSDLIDIKESSAARISSCYGSLFVRSGGVVSNTDFTNISISGGGVVSRITPKKIRVLVGPDDELVYAGSLHIYSGGTAYNTPPSSDGWIVTVDAGGVSSAGGPQ